MCKFAEYLDMMGLIPDEFYKFKFNRKEIDAMKVSTLMLDMALGDATIDDAYIQEALGHINISAGRFDAAYKISELPEEEIPFIQEAADNAKLPTDKGKAIQVANESVVKELSAFYKLILATAKKIRTITERELRGFQALGRKYGIEMDTYNFVTGFLGPLDNAIEKDGILGKLDERSFIKSKYAARMVENYGKGMANLMSGYGLSIDNVFGDSVVGLVVRTNYSGRKTVKDLRDVASNMSTGGKQLRFDETVNKNTHYQDYVKTVDFNNLAISIFALSHISDAIVRTMGTAEANKKAMDNIKRLCDEASNGGRRLVVSAHNISDGVKEWSTNLNNLKDNMLTAFSDSTYALLKLAKRSKK